MAPQELDLDGSSSKAVAQPSESKGETSGRSTNDTPKQPPPEKPADVRRRTWVVLSFWAIVVLFGLPIWWITTS